MRVTERITMVRLLELNIVVTDKEEGLAFSLARRMVRISSPLGLTEKSPNAQLNYIHKC